jgi:hypothetical protein
MSALHRLRFQNVLILAFLAAFLLLGLNTFYMGWKYQPPNYKPPNSSKSRFVSPSVKEQRAQLVLQRILSASEIHPEVSLVHLLHAELVCSNASGSPCPLFRPSIHKFEAVAEEIHSMVAEWSKISQSADLRKISLQMWYEKRMDIAAARVLGCAVVNGSELNAENEKLEDSVSTNAMCRSQQPINLLLPLVFHSYRGRFIDRNEYLHNSKNNEWYQSFKYNPLKITDSRLAYEAPAFTQEHLMQLCFRQVARLSKTSEIPQLQSRAWYACSSFAASTHSKQYHYGLLKCFDVPPLLLESNALPLSFFLSTYGSHREYVEQCRSNSTAILDDPWSLRELSMGFFNVLRERWDKVQSVYELAIYESSRDIQRSDEYVEALQWNTCNPNVEAIHLFIENDAVTSYFRSLNTSGSFHDPCKKLRSVFLGKRMHYKDALIHANKLANQTVMITNADIVLAQGFNSMPNLNSFLKENNRLFALSRHERPATVFATLCRIFTSFDACCFRDFLIVVCVAVKPDMMAVMMHSCRNSPRPFLFSSLLTAVRFVPPVKEDVFDLVDHQQNVWGAENKFM